MGQRRHIICKKLCGDNVVRISQWAREISNWKLPWSGNWLHQSKIKEFIVIFLEPQKKSTDTNLTCGCAQSPVCVSMQTTIWVWLWSRDSLAGPINETYDPVTFDLCYTPLTITLTLVCQLMRLSTHVQLWAVSGWMRACLCVKVGDCVEVVLLHPLKKLVVSLCWGCGRTTQTSLCAFNAVEAVLC